VVCIVRDSTRSGAGVLASAIHGPAAGPPRAAATATLPEGGTATIPEGLKPQHRRRHRPLPGGVLREAPLLADLLEHVLQSHDPDHLVERVHQGAVGLVGVAPARAVVDALHLLQAGVETAFSRAGHAAQTRF